MVKACSKCGETKSLTSFYRRSASPDGLQPLCKTCDNKRNRTYNKRFPHKNRIASAKYRSQNREECLRRQASWYMANKERWTAYRDNQDKAAIRSANVEYYKTHKADYVARLAKRRATKLRATPKWADEDMIKAIYKKAAQLTFDTGIKYHVDHVIPLIHGLVCGLHAHTNLEVVPAMLNHSKNNHRWPDMP